MAATPGRGTGPHVFVDDLDRPVLSADDRHHLARSLRTRPGEPLTISDGRGRWRAARFGDEVEAVGPVVEVPRPEPALTVALAPVKGQRPEWAVQKLTELGVDAIWLLVADRSVVRWQGDKAAAHAARLAKVAREAAMQSRRCDLPTVRAGVPVAEAVAVPGAAMAHPGGAPPGLDRPVVLIGPEGGWSEAELERAPGTVDLGPTVLRAETAAVVAASLLVGIRSGLVAHRPWFRGDSTEGG